MNMLEILFKAVGPKAFPLDKQKSDQVAYVRLAWIGVNLLACLCIIANFVLVHII